MILNNIKLGYPALWIKTPEFGRTIDFITSLDFRDYFMVDPVDGFCQYVDGQWKSVVVQMMDENNNVSYVKTFDLSVALDHLTKNPSVKPATFILQMTGKPETNLFRFIPSVVPLVSRYRQSFWHDEAFQDTQFIFLSSFPVPEEYPGIYPFFQLLLP